MSVIRDLLGTLRSTFKLGLSGVTLKNTSGNLAVRNTGDTADAQVTASQLNNSGDQIVINSDAAGSGSDWTMTLARNGSQTQTLQFTFPPTKSTDGYLLRQKAGTAAGVIEFEFVAPTSTVANDTTDTTTLSFGSTSPVAMFTLPATAIVDRIQVVIDTPFTGGTPSASVGVTGTASKYMAASDMDLTAAAGMVFEVTPGLPAPGGGGDALIITYAAGGATAGSARFLVYYTPQPT